MTPTTSMLRAATQHSAGSNWKSGGSGYWWTIFTAASNASSATDGATGDTKLKVAASLSNGAVHGLGARATLFKPAGTAAVKKFNIDSDYISSSGVLIRATGGGVYVASVAAITGVQFLMSSGNITSGTIRMYGLQK